MLNYDFDFADFFVVDFFLVDKKSIDLQLGSSPGPVHGIKNYAVFHRETMSEY